MQISVKAKIKWHHIWRRLKMLVAKDKRGVYPIGVTQLYLNVVEYALLRYGFSYNYFSFQYKHCVIDMRKLYLDDDENGVTTVRQIHVRVFDDGMVTAHDEFAYEWDAVSHYNAVGLCHISPSELNVLRMILSLREL